VLEFVGGRYTAASAGTLHKYMHDGTAELYVVAAVKFGITSNPATFYGLYGNDGTSSSNHGVSAYYEDGGAVNDRFTADIAAGVGGNYRRLSTTNNVLTANVWHVVRVGLSPGEAIANNRLGTHVDGVNVTSGSGTASLSTSNPTYAFQIGATGNSVGPLTGSIAEIFCYDDATADEAVAEAYLTDKYGI
jgi:hypothetical protein